MIDLAEFKEFLRATFPAEAIWVDEFKPGLQFIDIDCFDDQPVKLAIELSAEDIKISTVSKRPALDFSLYDYVFDDMAEAERLILQIKRTGVFPARQ